MLHNRSTQRQRAGFVESDHVHFPHLLDDRPRFDQDAAFGGVADGSYHCGRRSQHQRTRADHHQHGHGPQHIPGQQIHGNGNAEGDRHEHFGVLVGDALHRGLVRLGVFHQADDLPQGGLLAQAGDADFQQTGFVQRSGEDLIAGFLLHRHRFTGNGRLVHRGAAGCHHPIHADAFAGARQHGVAQDHLFQRDDLLLSIAAHHHLGWNQPGKVAQGAVGAGDGEVLQPFAYRHHENHQRCGGIFTDHDGCNRGCGGHHPGGDIAAQEQAFGSKEEERQPADDGGSQVQPFACARRAEQGNDKASQQQGDIGKGE